MQWKESLATATQSYFVYEIDICMTPWSTTGFSTLSMTEDIYPGHFFSLHLLKPSFPVIFLFDPLWSHNTCESLVITSVNKNRKDGTNNCLYSLLFFMLYLRCPTSLFFSSICIRRGYILSVSCWFNACQCVSHLCSKIKVRDAIPFSTDKNFLMMQGITFQELLLLQHNFQWMTWYLLFLCDSHVKEGMTMSVNALLLFSFFSLRSLRRRKSIKAADFASIFVHFLKCHQFIIFLGKKGEETTIISFLFSLFSYDTGWRWLFLTERLLFFFFLKIFVAKNMFMFQCRVVG